MIRLETVKLEGVSESPAGRCPVGNETGRDAAQRNSRARERDSRTTGTEAAVAIYAVEEKDRG